jgi:hypothetical protein
MHRLARFAPIIIALAIIGTALLSFQAQGQRAQVEQDAQLAALSTDSIARIRADMDWSRQRLVATTQQGGMVELLSDPTTRTIWKGQIDQRLASAPFLR